MSLLLKLALVTQILSALAMVVVIMFQQGQGADMGAAFGAGGAGSLFGASGSSSFLSRTTAVLVTIFLTSTLALAYFGYSVPTAAPASSGSVLERVPVTAPATDGALAPEPVVPGVADGIPTDDPVPPATDAAESDVPALEVPAELAPGVEQIPTE